MATPTSPLNPASQDFVEALGVVYQDDGLPRIAGRIMALLMLKDSSLSLHELADDLQVSRGSISTNTRLLEQFGMVERIAKPGDRQFFYRLAEDPYSSVMKGAVHRLKKASEVVSKARKGIPKSEKGAHSNLKEASKFYEVIIKGFEDIVKNYGNSGSR